MKACFRFKFEWIKMVKNNVGEDNNTPKEKIRIIEKKKKLLDMEMNRQRKRIIAKRVQTKKSLASLKLELTLYKTNIILPKRVPTIFFLQQIFLSNQL